MARYRFRAVDAAGRVVEGEREGADATALARLLRDEGLVPLGLLEAGAGRRSRGPWPNAGRPRRMGGDGLVLFTRQLATLVGAEMPIDQALGVIAGGPERGGAAAAARAVMAGLRRGASLSEAMSAAGAATGPEPREDAARKAPTTARAGAAARQPDTKASVPRGAALFPPGYVALVRAGEASGALARVLDDLAASLGRSRALERELRAALTYPGVVLAVTVAAVGLLLGVVIPEFAPLFADAGDALPTNARVVLAVSEAVRGAWREGLVALLLAGLGLMRLARLEPVRRRVDAALASLPVAGSLVRTAEGARFARALATLTANGVEVTPALELSIATMRNRHLAARLGGAIAQVRRGEGVAGPLEAADALPPLATQLIRAGESASRLPAMLETVADMLETDLRRRLQQLVGLVTPALTIVLGAVVALVIGAVLGAIMSTYDLPL